MLSDLILVEPGGRAEWRGWLELHHGSSPGIWLAIGKKGGTAATLTYEEAVLEALCFGWIDSTVRRLDSNRFQQLFTPRRPGSNWAASNKSRVSVLIEEGLMTPWGVAAIERAKADGSWTLLDEVEAMVMPDDLLSALMNEPGASAAFGDLPESSRKQALYWIASAKRPETRARRISETVRTALEGRPTP